MTSSEQPPKHIYLEKATPQDFMEANLGDWIQYVGDISTQYELIFIRNFGGFWSSRPHPSTCNIMTCEKATDGCLQTHPHPAPASIQYTPSKTMAEACQICKAEAARKAREDFAKGLIELFKAFEDQHVLRYSPHEMAEYVETFEKLISLRSTHPPQTEQEQPR